MGSRNYTWVYLATLWGICVFFEGIECQATVKEFCTNHLQPDNCVRTLLPSLPTTDTPENKKKQGCCFNSLRLDETRVHFCMQRVDQVTYWNWFYDQNGQVNKNILNQGWTNDHRACCFKALNNTKYQTVNCNIDEFGYDSTSSDTRLNEYTKCILQKLRARGTSL